jgi:hypothetical protein
VPFGPFCPVGPANDVSVDDHETDSPSAPQHDAFVVTEDEFDEVSARVRERDHWADPARRLPGRINHGHGGRGVCRGDPGGPLLEVLTRPSGDPGGGGARR